MYFPVSDLYVFSRSLLRQEAPIFLDVHGATDFTSKGYLQMI